MDGSSSSEVTSAPQPRGPGRPSTMELYAPRVAQWLREDPDLPGVEILRRVQLAGYRGARARSTRAREAAEGVAFRKPGQQLLT
jgi:hypothetical protein